MNIKILSNEFNEKVIFDNENHCRSKIGIMAFKLARKYHLSGVKVDTFHSPERHDLKSKYDVHRNYDVHFEIQL